MICVIDGTINLSRSEGKRERKQASTEMQGKWKVLPSVIHVSIGWVGREWNQDLINSRLIGLERNMDDDVHLRPKEKSWVLLIGLSFHNGRL